MKRFPPSSALSAAVVLAAAALAASDVPAQGQSANAGLGAALARLEPGMLIRVSTPDRRADGILVRVGQSRVTVVRDPGTLTVDLTPSDSLWVRGDAKRGGAMIGGAIGLGLVMLSCGQSFDECGLDVGLGIVTPALALVGAGIGSSIGRWRLLVPARPRPQAR